MLAVRFCTQSKHQFTLSFAYPCRMAYLLGRRCVCPYGLSQLGTLMYLTLIFMIAHLCIRGAAADGPSPYLGIRIRRLIFIACLLRWFYYEYYLFCCWFFFCFSLLFLLFALFFFFYSAWRIKIQKLIFMLSSCQTQSQIFTFVWHRERESERERARG